MGGTCGYCVEGRPVVAGTKACAVCTPMLRWAFGPMDVADLAEAMHDLAPSVRIAERLAGVR